MAFKLHLIQRTLRDLFKWMDKEQEAGATESETKLLEKFAKSLLVAREENFPKTLDLMVRQAIREFPYHQSIFFQQIVKTLSGTSLVNGPVFSRDRHLDIFWKFWAFAGSGAFGSQCGATGAVGTANGHGRIVLHHLRTGRRQQALLSLQNGMATRPSQFSRAARLLPASFRRPMGPQCQ